MPRFSASLGTLWPELTLLARVRAAAAAGFPAVECHWPYDVDPVALARSLDEAGTTLVSINTPPGNVARGEFGLAALSGREAEARAGIERAIAYARAAGARHVHVMAGCPVDGSAARRTLVGNLAHAASVAAPLRIGILVEAINRRDRPGYFPHDVSTAREIVDETSAPNVRLLFDCYHAGRSGADVVGELGRHLPVVGHVQVAAIPDRGEPDSGEIDYPVLFAALDDMGYGEYVGAEYVPRHGTEAGLGWYDPYRAHPRRTTNV